MTDDNQSDDADNRSDDAEADEEAHVDPDVPSESKTASEGGKVLTPEELEISDSEYVEPLDDDGRYVVSPGGGAPNASRSETEADSRSTAEDAPPGDDRQAAESRPTPSGPRDADQRGATGSPEAARTLLAEELARANARYGLDIVASFDGEPVRHRTVSNDVVGTFENLVRWYARRVADDTPVDQVIEILLSEARFGTEAEPNLAELLDAHDLDRHDSIADLVEAIRLESDRER